MAKSSHSRKRSASSSSTSRSTISTSSSSSYSSRRSSPHNRRSYSGSRSRTRINRSPSQSHSRGRQRHSSHSNHKRYSPRRSYSHRSRSPRRRSARSRSRSFSPRNRSYKINRSYIRRGSSYGNYERSVNRYDRTVAERRDVMPFTAEKEPPIDARMDMTAEERDERTIFVQQIARDIQPRDMEKFFLTVGQVRDVRIIKDPKTNKSKGIGYVEFWHAASVPVALGLSGTKLGGSPLIIQASNANLNRESVKGVGGALGFAPIPAYGPLKLRVSNLHPSISQEMLCAIFDPFGKMDSVEVIASDKNPDKSYSYVTFHQADDGKRALEQLNGFELAGRPMHVSLVEEFDSENPKPRSDQYQEVSPGVKFVTSPQVLNVSLPIQTRCLMLTNMFDPNSETDKNWDLDIRDEVIDEINQYGGIVHIFVDKEALQGNVYLKCPSTEVAYKCVTSLHGRWFAGKVIAVNYIPEESYQMLFPDSQFAKQLLQSRPI